MTSHRYGFPIRSCWISYDPESGLVETTFPDGSLLVAAPNTRPEDYERAAELGYGRDVRRMTLHHDVAHTFLADKLGLPYSPTLWSTARPSLPGASEGEEQRLWEEALVLDFQRLLNDPEYDSHTFAGLKVLGWNMRKLRREFLQILARHLASPT